MMRRSIGALCERNSLPRRLLDGYRTENLVEKSVFVQTGLPLAVPSNRIQPPLAGKSKETDRLNRP